MSKQDPIVHELFEGKTGSWQYLVADSVTKHAVIIDPVLDFEPTGCIVSTKSADGILDVVKQNGYKVKMILETHAHADHLTAASYLKSQLTKIPGGNHEPLICVGSNIKQIQDTWGRRYGISACEYQDVFDKFLTDNEEFSVGALKAKALHLPGHTPDLMGYMIADSVFVGDSIFNADLGSARADFPGGSAVDLFNSGRRLLSLSADAKIYTGHDYPPPGRVGPVSHMTVQEHRKWNKHLKDEVTREEFVRLRNERDVTLAEPKLIHYALQWNIRAGRWPREERGLTLMHVPIHTAGAKW